MDFTKRAAPAFRPAPIFNFGELDRITDNSVGKDYVWVDTSADDYRFRPRDGQGPEVLVSHDAFERDRSEGRIEVFKGESLPEKAEIRNIYQNFPMVGLSDERLRRAHFYADLFRAFLRRKAKDPRGVTTSESSLKYLMPLLAEDIREIWKSGKGRPGPNSGEASFLLPSPRHFRRLLKLFIDSGYQTAALVDRYGGQKIRGTKLLREEAAIRLEFASRFASPSRPKMAALHRALAAETTVRNQKRKDDGLPPLRLPSRKTFEKLIHSLDPFWVTAKREGPAAATQLFRITTEGVDVERPGERVEIDEWKVDLMALLVWLRVSENLSEKELKAVARARLWVTVAIDCATRCILAMRFTAKDPSAESSMAALEQVLMDKSEISSAVGTTSSWIQFCHPESVVTDTGAAFVATDFRTGLAELRIEHMMPPPGQPRLRPYIESFFRSSREFLSWYGGRTFSDYIEKGDYDPQENASVSADQLNGDFVRVVVDAYHNTQHAALQGETPLNAWLRLSKKHGVLPPPPAHIRRRVFGVRCKRRIGDKGVRILGLHFQSTALQQLRVHAGVQDVEVRFDRFDLSHAEVRVNNEWLTVPNRFGLPQGVSIWEWVGAARQLADIHAENAALKQDAMLNAINALRKSGEAAAARAELARPVVTDKHISALERQLFSRLKFLEEDTPPATPLAELAKPEDSFAIGLDLLDGGPATEPEHYDDTDEQAEHRGQFGSAADVAFDD